MIETSLVAPPDFTAPWLDAYRADLPDHQPVRVYDLTQHPDGDWYTCQLLSPGQSVKRPEYFNPQTGHSWSGFWTLRNRPPVNTRLPLECYNVHTCETAPVLTAYRSLGAEPRHLYNTPDVIPGSLCQFSADDGVVFSGGVRTPWIVRNLRLESSTLVTVTLDTTPDGHIRLMARTGPGEDDTQLSSLGAFGSTASARKSLPGLLRQFASLLEAGEQLDDD